jgi:hypothetical protein
MSHKAKIVKVEEVADGILSVKARCCGNKTTDSVLSLHELGRTDEEIDQTFSSTWRGSNNCTPIAIAQSNTSRG